MQNKYFLEGYRNTSFDSEISLEELMNAKAEGTVLEGRAIMCDADHNLWVELGVCRGVIPGDEVVYSPCGEKVKDIAIITRVGKRVCFVVTEIIRDGDDITAILSRKLAQKECYENYISTLNPGDIIDAAVTHIEPFGAFCDIGCGFISLLPIDCISVSRISSPSERFYPGMMIPAIIKSIDRELCRVTLTHKELLGTWLENAALFSAGQTVTGIIRSIESYGIFVELAPNLAGLAEWCDGCFVGQSAAVYIKSIIPEKMKIKLVIVDLSMGEAVLPEFTYFYKGDRIDSWSYAPPGSSKQLYVEF